MIGTAGDELHVFTLILCRIRFDLRIGVEGIASFVLAGIAGAFLGDIRPQLGGRSCAVGDASVFTVQAGLQQVDLDIAHGEGIGGGLRVGEVRQRCAHDGDGDQRHAQENGGQFLLHLLSLFSIIFLRLCAVENELKQPFKKAAFPKSNYACASNAAKAAFASAKPSAWIASACTRTLTVMVPSSDTLIKCFSTAVWMSALVTFLPIPT